MNKIKKILPHLIFILSVIANVISRGYGGKAVIAKLIILFVTPIYLVWLTLRYSRPGKVMKYRMIVNFLGIGSFVFLPIIISELTKYFPVLREKYLIVIGIVCGLIVISSIIIMGIMVNKIKDDEFLNKPL